MHVIHGTWIPDDTSDFMQNEAFYLWVETDTLLTSSDKRRCSAEAIHPRHLMNTALATFLIEELGVRESASGALEQTLCRKYFLLPIAADNAALFDKEALIRHFSECLLHDIVTGTPFTAKFDQQLSDTLLYGCVYPYRPAQFQTPDAALVDYKHWLSWRINLTRAHMEAGFTLCFRLEVASSNDIDNWQLHFLVTARHDPSLKLGLDEYWRLKPAARTAATRPFGQDFESGILKHTLHYNTYYIASRS